MLPREDEELLDIEPDIAAEELLQRMLDAKRYRGAALHLIAKLHGEDGVRFRSAPLPAHLRSSDIADLEAVYKPARLGRAIGSLLTLPPKVDIRHLTIPRVSVADRLAHLRRLLRAPSGRTTFEEAVKGADRVTVCVTLFALLELYKQGEATWSQDEPFGEIEIRAGADSQAARPAAAA
jgi:segregation and condensation protein A